MLLTRPRGQKTHENDRGSAANDRARDDR